MYKSLSLRYVCNLFLHCLWQQANKASLNLLTAHTKRVKRASTAADYLSNQAESMNSDYQ